MTLRASGTARAARLAAPPAADADTACAPARRGGGRLRNVPRCPSRDGRRRPSADAPADAHTLKRACAGDACPNTAAQAHSVQGLHRRARIRGDRRGDPKKTLIQLPSALAHSLLACASLASSTSGARASSAGGPTGPRTKSVEEGGASFPSSIGVGKSLCGFVERASIFAWLCAVVLVRRAINALGQHQNGTSYSKPKGRGE